MSSGMKESRARAKLLSCMIERFSKMQVLQDGGSSSGTYVASHLNPTPFLALDQILHAASSIASGLFRA